MGRVQEDYTIVFLWPCKQHSRLLASLGFICLQHSSIFQRFRTPHLVITTRTLNVGHHDLKGSTGVTRSPSHDGMGAWAVMEWEVEQLTINSVWI